MANPNLAAATSVYANNAQVSLTATTATLLVANAASSGKAYLIDSIVVANVDGTNAADISVVRFNSATNTGTAFPLCSTVTVPADASLIVVGSENKISLTENESIYVTASAANDLVVDCNWKELS
jgi:hypothetical protein